MSNSVRTLRVLVALTVAVSCLIAPGVVPAAGSPPAQPTPTSSTHATGGRTTQVAADQPAVGWDSYRHLDRLAEIGSDTRSRQFSSFDRSDGNDDGFDGTYSCLRTDDGCVIAERSGAGEISSIWFTRDGGDVSNTGNITIELDGTVVLDAPLQDVVDGKLGAPFSQPLVANADQSSGGVYIKVPMPYRTSMKITTTHNPLFYHVTYRDFSSAVGVTTFDPDDQALDVIKKLRAAGTADPKPAQPDTETISTSVDLAAGRSQVLARSHGPGAVTALKLRLPQLAQTKIDRARRAPARPTDSSIDPRKARWLRPDPITAQQTDATKITDQILAGARIRVTVDGQRTVDAPLGEFFGTGLGLYDVRSLMFGVDAQTKTLQAWWLMPYAGNVKIELANRSEASIENATAAVTVSDNAAWKQRLRNHQVGYFQATSNREQTPFDQDHLFLHTQGTGRVVGVSQTVEGLIPDGNLRNYLEGDERVFVDGSASPDWHGTGTEDFYEGGWYFNRGTFNAPMNGNPAHEEAGGGCRYDCTSLYRLMVSEAIDFDSSIRFGIEHGPGNDADAIEGSTTYWYGQDGGRLRWTDSVDLGDARSERAHDYRPTAPDDSVFQQTSRYEGIDGPDEPITLDGRTATGPISFRLTITRSNTGVLLRRISDQSRPYQRADVRIDGRAAGTWLQPLGNDHDRWLDDAFAIPPDLTRGKSSISVQLTPSDQAPGWQAASYQALSKITDATDRRAPGRINGPVATPDEFTGITLGWQPATDDVYAPHYQVFASTTAGFTPSEETLVGTTRGNGFTHLGLDVDQTWHYRVRAVDDAGHTGPFSAEIEATTGRTLRIEAESLIADATATAPVQLQGNCCGLTWSGDAQLWFTPDAADNTVTMRFELGTAGRYRLSGLQTMAADYGINTLTLDGKQLGEAFDAYHTPGVVLSDPIDYGERELAAGQHTLELRVTGRNDAATSYMAGLDYLQLQRQP
ncbi:DUF2961 domain-containing protein [Microlunatus soli]|uniref:Fibronectin type-III domain-containing protein n=1 Tax=Microlunatus soli TaxID=630515 RepID=A0A1H1RIA8_9ACTN|nr:DUF2961 domain-containing protein [Microlunatus soli]SDS35276.1 Protein of unknown function [Microlunatus soli]